MKALPGSLLLLLLTIYARAQTVTLYSDCNYRGNYVTLGVGNYVASQHGLGTRELSSLVIPKGFVVNLFSKDYFEGSYISLTSSTSCLTGQFFNDKMVSIQVIDAGLGYVSNQSPVVIYRLCNFSGRGEPLYEGSYSQINGGFNGIQSIRVAPGYGVLFRKENRVGNSVTTTTEEYRGDRSCTGLLWGMYITGAYIYRLDNVYDGYWNNNTTVINNFNEGAVVFSDINLRGRGQALHPGAFRSYQLTQVGERNISSIKLSPGYRAIVFSGSDFDGSSIVFTNSVLNLHSLPVNWGNRIGSMVVEKIRNPNPGYVGGTGNPGVVGGSGNPGYVGGTSSINTNPGSVSTSVPQRPQPANQQEYVIAFADANYQGSSQVFAPGNYQSNQFAGVSPQSISSIRIPPGYKVTVFDGPSFNGDYRILSYSIDNFVTEGQGRWNDRIASMIIEKQ